MRTAALVPILLTSLLTSGAGACLNDRDTLVRELASPPGVLTALTGRFERLPPAYYEARVTRLRGLARPTPEELDDLGVALDRLGRDDEALAAMARKAALPGLGREARYRLHANRGTFLAHRALATRAPASALDAAIEDIETAIRLKPNAHFGREGVQLRVLQWISIHKTDPKTPDLGTVLVHEVKQDPAKTATALAGLIELGNAWESPDVVAAIGALVPAIDEEASSKLDNRDQEATVLRRAGVYARLRYDELRAKGLKPLDSEAETAFTPGGYRTVGDEERATLEGEWRRERTAADTRTRARAEYVLAGLAAGRHPDTDPDFWRGWREPASAVAPLISKQVSHAREREARRNGQNLTVGTGLLVVGLGLTLVVLLVRAVIHVARPRRLGAG